MEDTSNTPESVTANILNYLTSLDSFTESINQLVEESDNGADGFVEKHLVRFSEIFGHTIALWTSMGCKTYSEFQSFLKEMSIVGKKNEQLAEALEDYLKSDEKWDAFVQRLDETLSNPLPPNEDAIIELESLENPGKFEILSDITSSGSKLFRNVQNELAELGCQVVVVSYGSPDGASRWKEETSCPFPIYLDRERKLFAKHKMQRSIAKLYHRATLTGVTEKIIGGTKFLTPYEGIFDDAVQMGGDVVLGSNDEIVYEYQSKYPNDRPSVQSVMECLKH